MSGATKSMLLAGGLVGGVVGLSDFAAARGADDYRARQSITIPGVFRDFEPGSNPDFGGSATDGAGRYVGIVAPELADDGSLVFAGTGSKVVSPATDADGNPIALTSYIDEMDGDAAAVVGGSGGGAVTGESSFGEWFTDVPGVNTTQSGTVTLQRDESNTKYVFEGTLDSGGDLGAAGGAGTNDAYTYEMETTFVHDAAEDWHIDVSTAADVWIFIDGKLVLDGGSGAGVEMMDDFGISNGVVRPNQPFAAQMKVLGVAFRLDGYDLPVTMRAKVGGTSFEPFGSMSSPSSGNVNDGDNPRTYTFPSIYPAGTPVTVTGQSWYKTTKLYNVDSGSASKFVKVLRDGDAVPDIKPFQDQAAAAEFLKDYIDMDEGVVRLAPNQVIYLYELATDDLSSEYVDFQDLVVLMSFAKDVASLPADGASGGSTPEMIPAPSMTQRIDLSRLAWLSDGTTHTMQVFIADRGSDPAPFRLETNITTLNLAASPVAFGAD